MFLRRRDSGFSGHRGGAGAECDRNRVSSGPDGIGAILSLAIDPTAPSTLYAGTDGGGVYKSTDGAATWVSSSSGLTDFSVFALAVDPAVPAIVYAGTASGLFVSLDGGGGWALVAGLPHTVFGAVVFDPANASTVYAVSTDAGVFKSPDAGTTWTSINAGLAGTNPSTLAVDPSSSSTLYVGTIQNGVYKSSNGGGSWATINGGLTNLHVQTLTIDPTAPSRSMPEQPTGAHTRPSRRFRWSRPTRVSWLTRCQRSASTLLIL